MSPSEFEGNENLIADVESALSVTDTEGYLIFKSTKGVYRVLFRANPPNLMLAKIDLNPDAFKEAPTIGDRSTADKALKLVFRAGMVLDANEAQMKGAGKKKHKVKVEVFNTADALASLNKPSEIDFVDDTSSIDTLTMHMQELKFLSTDSQKSNVPEEIAEYRRNLENLLLLPKYNYVQDYYEM